MRILGSKTQDAFDDIEDAFSDVELPADEKLLYSPDLEKKIEKLVQQKLLAAIATLPKPESVKETIREVRVEVPKKDARDLVEKSELEAALKEIETLKKELKETTRKAESPVVVGGPGVIGIPPPEQSTVGYVLTVDADKKARFKASTGGGGGASISGYTINNGTTQKTLEGGDNATLDNIVQVLGTLLTELQA